MREEQFLRLEMLLGKENVTQLHRKKITIIGAGAVGGYAFESLVRSGIGFIRIVDSDTFCLSNLNRQILATYDTLGMPKVEAAKARALSINPEIKIDAVNAFADESNCRDLVKDSDLVIDCIDTVASKACLMKICQEENIPLISSMGAALRRDISRIRVATLDKTHVCPLAKAVHTKPLCPRPVLPAADRAHRIARHYLKWLRGLLRLTLWGQQSAEKKMSLSFALTAFRGKCCIPVGGCVIKKSLHLIVKVQNICFMHRTNIVCG